MGSEAAARLVLEDRGGSARELNSRGANGDVSKADGYVKAPPRYAEAHAAVT